MLKGRSWRRLMPDVYVAADAYDADDHVMWCRAVALTLKSGDAIDRYSAAFLWGVDLLPYATAPVSVTRSAPEWPHPRRNTIRAKLEPGEITTLAGIPVTVPIRTAFDLGRQPNRVHALVALDAFCHRRLVRLPDIADYLSERPRWPGVCSLRELLTLVDARAESPMETRLRLLLHDAGTPAPVPQYDVRDADGRFLARVDLAYPQWRIALEYEGDHHREKTQFRRDIARVNALRQAGWLVLRFTADDVLRHPRQVVQHVLDAIRERR
jgi:Protein of unknown function (DUF559)